LRCGLDCAVVGDPVCLQVEPIALIDAAFGDGSAAIGSRYGPIRAGDLRCREPFGTPLVRPDNLSEVNLLILDKRSRGAFLIGYSSIDTFIES